VIGLGEGVGDGRTLGEAEGAAPVTFTTVVVDPDDPDLVLHPIVFATCVYVGLPEQSKTA
jgi:hypothetical protein